MLCVSFPRSMCAALFAAGILLVNPALAPAQDLALDQAETEIAPADVQIAQAGGTQDEAEENDEANRTDEQRATRRERNRARWEKLSPERRDELRRVHEALRKLDPEKREALKKRLRELDPERAERMLANRARFRHSPEQDEFRHRHEVLRRFQRGLSPEERQRVASLPHDEFRQFIEARMEKHILQFRDSLSLEEQVQFDGLDRRQKLDLLRWRHMQKTLAEFREGLSAEELIAFEALDPRSQRREMHKKWRGTNRGGPGEGRGGERRGPPPPEWLEPHIEEFRSLPRSAVRAFIREGVFPEGTNRSPQLRALIEGLDPGQLDELRRAVGRPSRSEPFERPGRIDGPGGDRPGRGPGRGRPDRSDTPPGDGPPGRGGPPRGERRLQL